jgi:pimeloyl-ACP methyl ester carboxylesterase
VVFYDPRQRGRSEPATDSTTSTFAGDVDDVEAVRAHFALSRFALVGFSYFGLVAVQYAADHPERVTRLALVSPVEPDDSLARLNDPKAAMARIDTVKARQLVRLRAAGKDTADVAGYCRAYWEVNAPVYVGDTLKASQVPTDVCALPNEGIREFGAHVARVMASLGGRRDFSAAAARVRAPTLVVSGDRDLVASPLGARAWAERIPDARLLSVAGGGHLVFVDDPAGVVRALDAFLRGGWPEGALVVRR